MKFFVAILFSITSALVTACAQTTPSVAGTELIQARQDAFTSAFGEGSEAKISSMFTEDITIAPPGAGIISGKSEVTEFWMNMRKGPVRTAKTKTLQVDAVSDDLILEIGEYEVFDADGNSLGTGTSVLTWRKVGTEWLMELDHWN